MNFETIGVPVIGGELNVGVHEGAQGAPAVVLIHGITANHHTWSLVADHLSDLTLLAPDLRGRAGSASLPGPYGMRSHARDIVAILDHVGVDTATIVGHSMGGFVTAAFAVDYPDRVAGLVLVDGGVTIAEAPAGTDIDAVLTQILGPTMQRLSMTFESEDAWLAFWKQHPSLQEWNDTIEAYVMADIVGEPPNLRSGCNVEAIRADGADTLGEGGLLFRRVQRPMPWLRAPRGLLNAEPLYSDAVAAQMVAEYPMLRDILVDDVNHFTITVSERGARAVAEVIRTQVP
ncbi:MAG TPA: alpha/beta hydrolase [Acidimicrobiales bacterium]|nr:alpha/beta hydrolase [Acidimicrobiales bacterium]